MTFELELPRELESAASARQAVGELSDRLPEDLIGDIRLLVSELVTNALRHGELSADDRIVLGVDVRPDVVHVEVRDPGKGFDPPQLGSDEPDAGAGWGLYLVSTLADRWGVARESVTRVWFELDRPAGGGSVGEAA